MKKNVDVILKLVLLERKIDFLKSHFPNNSFTLTLNDFVIDSDLHCLTYNDMCLITNYGLPMSVFIDDSKNGLSFA